MTPVSDCLVLVLWRQLGTNPCWVMVLSTQDMSKLFSTGVDCVKELTYLVAIHLLLCDVVFERFNANHVEDSDVAREKVVMV